MIKTDLLEGRRQLGITPPAHAHEGSLCSHRPEQTSQASIAIVKMPLEILEGDQVYDFTTHTNVDDFGYTIRGALSPPNTSRAPRLGDSEHIFMPETDRRGLSQTTLRAWMHRRQGEHQGP